MTLEKNPSKSRDSPSGKAVAKERIPEKFDLLKGNFVSAKYSLSSAYIPSFQKKEVGSVGQRIQLAPLAGQHTNSEAWKRRADRTETKGSNYSALGRTAGNLMTGAPAVQPVHGRVDWTSKYGGNR
ncbi:unnamed protein product [Tetraodon nigroviridis]|uniref:(spotted green pufferfish) hypothetical protein n=1 Tax=Tetraodon nigroviridis TaxID=99883 RepID=Q4SY63_TETNG|nr:unnamed protein product [Tetraodon nigroviridis]